jgi:hypothetical protein
MNKTKLLASLIVLFVVAGTANAFNAPVNIASPVNGSTVTNYFYSSFTTTCPGGQHSVKWMLDGVSTGSASFYNTAGVHFAHKLPTGWHTLFVSSTCGQDQVRFYVQ